MVDLSVMDLGGSSLPHVRDEEGRVHVDGSVAELHEDARTSLREGLAFGIAADELGYDYLIGTEHHCRLSGHSFSGNPLMLHVAIAQHTESIRLKQMVNVLPWHDPVRLAEQAAYLDVLSDGRLEFGIGRGTLNSEAETMGQYWGGNLIHDEQNRATFEEKYEIILAAWTNDLVSYHGEFHQVPPSWTVHDHEMDRAYLESDATAYELEDVVDWPEADEDRPPTMTSVPVFPQPVQEPYPQVWMPTISERSVRWAAERGINAYALAISPEFLADVVERYYDACEAADWPDRRPGYEGDPFAYGWDAERRRGVVASIKVFNTEAASSSAVRRYERGVEAGEVYAYSAGRAEIDDFQDVRARDVIDENYMYVVGDDDHIADTLADLVESVGYRDVHLNVDFGAPGLPAEAHREQLRAFAEEVGPYLDEEFA